MKKAMIAMSGGVDSSVAALLMKQQGFDCIGVTMKLFSNDDICQKSEKSCCSLADVEDARSVAFSLDIPFYVLNFSSDFRSKVIEPFVRAYGQGKTPNPCIECNRYMKFEKLALRAAQLQIDYVVSGHYARIEFDEQKKRYILRKGLDDSKDQSYVLYAMTQEQLAHTLFPLGGLTKSEVRRIAEENGFTNSRKTDSQDICFVRDGDYAGFIEEFTAKTFPTGDFIDPIGKVLGKHRGIIHYTIGQRRGLGLSFPDPRYVGAIDAVANTVTVCRDEELFKRELYAADLNWIAFDKPTGHFAVKAKIRYKQTEQSAVVYPQEDGTILVRFDEPQRAIAAGQAVVLYDGDMVIGGGTIL